MRRLGSGRPWAGHINDHHNERGASAIIVALLGTVLLGFAAISVDVGRLYWEKAQLQSGADTAALSIANACGKSLSDPVCTGYQSKAQYLANASANDGLTQLPPVALDTVAGKVTTITQAAETGGPAFGKVSVFFAQVLDASYANGVEVSATATATWGAPVESTSKFPLAFSVCELDASATTDGTLQFIQSHGVGDKIGDDGCHKGGSGQEIPGGFGWLPPDPDDACAAKTAVGEWSPSRTGNSWEGNCTSQMAKWQADIEAGKQVVVLLPVFNSTSGTGNNGEFLIWAYAAFEVHGWHFTGGGPSYLPADAKAVFDAGGYKNSDTGFVGRFIRYVFTDEDAAIGTAPSTTGANIVTLTE